ncbi:MAG TPA: GNAT family N-acetyltransferase [Devosiaceae bacterium]|nr:GNAT family N-acetyltransferase [Devosiaceae bacterium]
MLVPLYRVNDWQTAISAVRANGVAVRPALASERRPVVDWVERTFHAGWAGEAEAGFSFIPTTCLVAVRDGEILGFACHDVTALGFFGPTGVSPEHRKQGIGTALLYETLNAMRMRGYAYAVIGGVGTVGFYERTTGAIPIADSDPGIYAGLVPHRGA